MEALAEAGADMFTFHASVVVGGSNGRSWGQHVSFHVCVVVGGSNGRSWGQRVYVPCLCCSGWKQWQKLGLTCLRSMLVL